MMMKHTHSERDSSSWLNHLPCLVIVGTAKAQHSGVKMFANVYIRICPLKSARIVKTSLQFFSDKTETT